MHRKALGKGLEALIPSSGPGTMEAPRSSLREIPIEQVEPNPFQPRTRFDEAALRELADSILATGILQPIVVGPKVRNVPKEGYYAWDPGGYIGLYKPDTFWLSQ